MTDSRFIVLGIPDKRPTIMGYRKGKSIILEVLSDPPYARGISFEFTKHEYFVFYRQLLGMAQEIWPDLVLKEITGAGNDYGEYYDRELDNDGSASIGAEGISFGHQHLIWNLIGYIGLQNRRYRPICLI